MNTYFKILDLLESGLEKIKSSSLTKLEKEMMLCHASELGLKDVVVFLCTETDVDIHHQNDQVLLFASGANQFDIVDYFFSLDKNWNSSWTILSAAKNSAKWLKHFLVVRNLPFDDKDIIENALIAAAETDNIGSFEFIHKFKHINSFSEKVFDTASFFCSFKIIDFLLQCGVEKERFSSLSFNLSQIFRRSKVNAANKIGTWWIPICYDLNRESGQRMMWNSWKRVEREMSFLN